MKKGILTQKGTTLLELVIYFTVVGVILFAAITFAIQIININKLSNNYNELQSNLNFIAEKIITAIQSADSINEEESTFDSDDGVLYLDYNDPDNSYVKFYLSDGNIFIEQEFSGTAKLNSDQIIFNSLNFKKISYDKVPDLIMIEAKLGLTDNEIAQIDKELILHTSISLRK